MSTLKEIRAKARKQLGGHIFSNMWLSTLLVCLIYDVVISFGTYTAIIALLIGGAMEYGLSRILIETTKGKESVDFGKLFCGFNECFGDTFLLALLRDVFLFLWTLLLIIPGIIKSYSYSMAFFIQQDGENKDWHDCLDQSRKMMDGNKGRLFLLDLSFIGWYILGALCLGVGILFVIPYHQQARACFYQELKMELKTFGKTENN